jgi:aminodeoxyfutalosine deaminase
MTLTGHKAHTGPGDCLATLAWCDTNQAPMANLHLAWNEHGVITHCHPLGEPQEGQPTPYNATTGELLVLTPGLVNLHTHLALSGYPLVAGRHRFGDWLLEVVRLTRAPSALSLAERNHQGVAELLASGCVAVADVAPAAAAAEVLTALAQVGYSGHVSVEAFHPWPTLRPGTLQQTEVAYRQAEATWQALGAPANLGVGLSPHSPYNVSPAAWRHWQRSLAPSVIHTHLAESNDEAAWCQGHNATGIEALHLAVLGAALTPQALGQQTAWSSSVAYLADHSLLSPALLAAHAVTLDEQAWETLGQANVAVAHCPRSNLALHGQSLATQALLAHGRWGFGTDSHLSTPNLDVRTEAWCAVTQLGLPPLQAWWGLTQGGAACLGLGDRLGRLATGYQASLCWWRLACPTPQQTEALATQPAALAEALLHPSTQLAGLLLNGSWVQPLG